MKKNGFLSFLNKKDYYCMTGLMFLFAIMAFFRLGNRYAPETGYTATDQNRDIVIDFGEYTEVDSLFVFLGNLNTRHLALSAFNEVTGAWEIINGDVTAESVFAWNEIGVHYKLRYLGVVCTDDEAVFQEFVFKKTDGSLLLPVNTYDYPALFDEQALFPDTKTYMTGTMFDEVYHGRTAYEFIHGLPAYETTHPHLGKILISLGIYMFGMTPFGWRFMSAVFGILLVGVMYLFAKRLSESTLIASVTTALLTFDCMHYTLSRIATIDIFAAFFILLMYFFMYDFFIRDKEAIPLGTKERQSASVLLPLALSGISMALGIATKWTGVYAGIGLAVLLFWYLLTHFPKKYTFKLFCFCLIFFVAVPIFVYILSFLPAVSYTEYNNLIDKAVKGSLSMYDYHSGLVAEHYYSSPFYEWPVIWMPLLYANDMVSETLVSAVSCMGNPVIWWSGIFCVLFLLYRFLFRKDKKAGFLCIAYAAQYVPWMSVGRITFIYHYFPAVLFVILMIGYTLQLLTEGFSWGKKAAVLYLAAAVICFLIFFPVVSGLPFPKEWGLHLRLLKDWILVL